MHSFCHIVSAIAVALAAMLNIFVPDLAPQTKNYMLIYLYKTGLIDVFLYKCATPLQLRTVHMTGQKIITSCL